MMDETKCLLDVAKIRKCSYLLPDPGGEVARELCDTVDELREALTLLLNDESPLCLSETFNHLANGVEHLLSDHDCDVHGHKLLREALTEWRDIQDRIKKARTLTNKDTMSETKLTAEELLAMTLEERRKLAAYDCNLQGTNEFCSDCTGCSGCMGCVDCIGCNKCTNCMKCTNCKNCTNCTDCIGIINGHHLRYVAYGVQLTEDQWRTLREADGKDGGLP